MQSLTSPAPYVGNYSREPMFIVLTDENPELPIHERLYRRIRTLVISGKLAPGCRLASSRALAKQMHISRNSVMLALERLTADGYLDSRRGSGVYVANPAEQQSAD